MAVRLRVASGSREHEVHVQREDGLYRVVVDGAVHEVDARVVEGGVYSLLWGGWSYEVLVEQQEPGRYLVRQGTALRTVEVRESGTAPAGALPRRAAGPEAVVAVMPGKVVRVLVRPGDVVEAGQGLVVLEAMKMENEVTSPRAGKVTSVAVEPGQAVEAGALLVRVE